mmetsp:Transcript_24604/g.24199  ORF Transcript_24604/g.24199 Transcript_24604/m.24199 type:complete len:186 (-) Transcript_24604:876-1433(-)
MCHHKVGLGHYGLVPFLILYVEGSGVRRRVRFVLKPQLLRHDLAQILLIFILTLIAVVSDPPLEGKLEHAGIFLYSLLLLTLFLFFLTTDFLHILVFILLLQSYLIGITRALVEWGMVLRQVLSLLLYSFLPSRDKHLLSLHIMLEEVRFYVFFIVRGAFVDVFDIVDEVGGALRLLRLISLDVL